MPVGLQLVGRAYNEYDVVRAAATYEAAQPAGYNVRRFPAPATWGRIPDLSLPATAAQKTRAATISFS